MLGGGRTPGSLLCGVGGQGVLVQVGKRLIYFSLDNQQEQAAPRYQCEENIQPLCTDGISGMRGVYSYYIIAITPLGEAV